MNPESNTPVPEMVPFPTDTIVQWVYNKPKGKNNTHRRRIGYVIAAKDADGLINIGWSKCASHDAFDLDLARQIAFGRLVTGTDTPLPACFKKFMPEFILRCKKYFQSNAVQEIQFYIN
jgi:hypothetical protein